jgi:hypothetical protein
MTDKKSCGALTALVVLAGCSSPSFEYSEVEPTRARVGERVFDVYATGSTAHAFRMNREWGAEMDSVMADAAIAIEQATKCQVDRESLSGDVAIVHAKITC